MATSIVDPHLNRNVPVDQLTARDLVRLASIAPGKFYEVAIAELSKRVVAAETVYVVLESVTGVFVGAFSTREKAQTYCDRHRRPYLPGDPYIIQPERLDIVYGEEV